MDDRPQASARNLNLKKKFVSDGVFKAELRSLLYNSLAQQGFAGIDVLATNTMTSVNIYASRSSDVIGQNQLRIRELSSLIRKRFSMSAQSLELYAKKVVNKGLSAAVQAQSIKFSLAAGVPVRMAANRVIRFVMRDRAKGIEVAVSGKLRAQRAKTMKFKDGYVISTGKPKDIFVDEAIRHVPMKQGILGVRVKILLPHDPEGESGPKKPLPDVIEIIEPKDKGGFDEF